MYSVFMFLFYLITRLDTIFIVVATVMFFVTIITAIVRICVAYDVDVFNESSSDEFDKEKITKKHWNQLKAMLSAFIVFSIFSIFFPTKSEIIGFYALSQVDAYNESQEDSNLDIQNIIGNADKGIEELTDFVLNITTFIEEKINGNGSSVDTSQVQTE